jgi:hypothetical protein
VEERGEASLGHVIEDEQLLPLGPQVVGPQREQVRVPDLPQHRRLRLELLVPLGDLLPQPLHGHQAAVLQRGLVHRPVGALAHDLRRRAQQVVRRERQGPVEVHQLPAHVAAAGVVRFSWLLPAPSSCRRGAGVPGRRLLPAPRSHRRGPLFREEAEQEATEEQQDEDADDDADDDEYQLLGAEPALFVPVLLLLSRSR